MIRRRSLLAPALILVVLGFAGCSKTQDTAPGTRIFGSHPLIEGPPTLDPTPSTVNCDFTEPLNYLFEAQMLGPTLIGGTFGHFRLTVKVSDPDSTDPARKDNILLVSASYTQPGQGSATYENTLVLFDDGSPIQEDPQQGLFQLQESQVDLNCRAAAGDGGVICERANFQLTSGDAVKDDGIYTRNFAIVQDQIKGSSITIKTLFKDCVKKENREWVGVWFDTGVPISLRIDVVDREGNLTRGSAPTYITTASEISCTGDLCVCCVLKLGTTDATSENGACRGLPGVYGPTKPEGFCNTPLPS